MSLYLERYAWKEALFPDYQPPDSLGMIVVIPAYKEVSIEQALKSLSNCLLPSSDVLIIVLINEGEDESAEISSINSDCMETVKVFNSPFQILYSYQKLPTKKAGVGLARKIGMDEAVRIFNKVDHDGIIVCFDADCTCETDYLVEIEKQFMDGAEAGIVFYEHRLHGDNHQAILQYELYLRYYIDSIRYTGFPYAHQTLGSCIVVKSSTYQKHGGMNTRKAGEDFYFLNKVIPHCEFVEINSTTIRPSDRISNRVPFGTGKAVGELVNSTVPYLVYNPKTFEDLKVFFNQIEAMWNEEILEVPTSISTFFDGNTESSIRGVKSQTASFSSFKKRFFQWFDAFRILKFVHFSRDHFYENVELRHALGWLANKTIPLNGSVESQLILLRSFDRENFTTMIEIVQLSDDQWQEGKEIRLKALKNEPSAFSSTFENESRLSSVDWKNRNRNALYARVDGTVVGIVVILNLEGGDQATLNAMYVQKEHRGKGIGNFLVQSALQKLIVPTVKVVKLSVNTQRHAAIELYKKNGFEITDISKKTLQSGSKYYDEFIMELRF